MVNFRIFNEKDASTEFYNILENVANEINSKSEEYILNVDQVEFREFIIEKYNLIPLQIYTEQVNVDFLNKQHEQVHSFRGEYRAEVLNFQITVPYTGSYLILRLRPGKRTLTSTLIGVKSGATNFITGNIKLSSQDKQEFERQKKTFLRTIIANVANINNEVIHFNSRIGSHFDQLFNSLKNKYKGESDFFKSLNIEINPGTQRIFNVPTIKKVKIPEPKVDKANKSEYTQVPTLPNNVYDDVLKVIYDFYKNVEKKPSIYKAKDEEDLRDYLLPMIETRYTSTTASGETFNKTGKTDIILKYEDGTNLFIAECKFWKGEIAFHASINQLFDKYLTWRDSKVAIIIFVKNKDFSAVLKKIRESVKNHDYYKHDNGNKGESSFSYVFQFPDDPSKNIYTEIMAFSFLE